MGEVAQLHRPGFTPLDLDHPHAAAGLAVPTDQHFPDHADPNRVNRSFMVVVPKA